ncbi:MAG: hypothetical protein JWR26_4793 [Pedosphaera sp.]|nr:hypothetical protein [Pedosphaera sp.]
MKNFFLLLVIVALGSGCAGPFYEMVGKPHPAISPFQVTWLDTSEQPKHSELIAVYKGWIYSGDEKAVKAEVATLKEKMTAYSAKIGANAVIFDDINLVPSQGSASQFEDFLVSVRAFYVPEGEKLSPDDFVFPEAGKPSEAKVSLPK